MESGTVNESKVWCTGSSMQDTQQHNFEEGVVFAGCGVMGVGAN